MGRGIRPIQAFGADGQRAALEMAEALGHMNEQTRSFYAHHYDENGNLLKPDNARPVYGTITVNLTCK